MKLTKKQFGKYLSETRSLFCGHKELMEVMITTAKMSDIDVPLSAVYAVDDLKCAIYNLAQARKQCR